MANSLLNLKPHKVSRDLSGYVTYIYGKGGTGKTTLATQMDSAILIAMERGYNALPGVLARDVTSWSDFRTVVRELKDPEVKKLFKCVVIDTVDIAASLCEKYICGQLGIENIGDGGWATNGWAKVKKEFETTFRQIAQLGYAIFFISHDKERTENLGDGTEITKIGPSLSNAYNEIIRNMSDLEGFAHQVRLENGVPQVMLTLRSMDGRVECKSRFKYMEPEIPFNYEALSTALAEAIEKEAEANHNKFITDEKIEKVEAPDYNFEELMTEFKKIVGQIQKAVGKEDFRETWAAKITGITDKYLGKGRKVNDATPDQVEQIFLIVEDLKEVVGNGL